ncbi:MAG: methyltransferase domain-containing protein [Alphaproteobacteria bacterium]
MGHRPETEGSIAGIDRSLVGVAGWARRSPVWLHFWRFLANPFRVVAVVPASNAMARLIARQVRRKDHELVVELGAGTGAVTRALLAAGVPSNRLVAVELDARMAEFLRSALPGVTIVEGDAFDLTSTLPAQVMEQVGTVICGVPLAAEPLDRQRRFVSEALSLLAPGGRLLVFSYWITSPLPAARLGLSCVGRAFTARNFPPASVWIYERAGGGA